MVVAPSEPTSAGTTTTSQILGFYAGKAAAIDQEDTIAGLEKQVDHWSRRANDLEAELADVRAEYGKGYAQVVQAVENQSVDVLVSNLKSPLRCWCNFIASDCKYYVCSGSSHCLGSFAVGLRFLCEWSGKQYQR